MPSEQEQVQQYYNEFFKVRENHSRPYRQFNNAGFSTNIRSLTQYIDYSWAKFNQYLDLNEDQIEDYEVILAFPTIRNKLMAILAQTAGMRLKPEVFPQNAKQPYDKQLSEFFGHIMDWSNEQFGYLKVQRDWLLETLMKGTGILLCDYQKNVRTFKNQPKAVTDELVHKVIPLEDFYVWNVREPDIQKQYKVFWHTVMDIDTFYNTFQTYPKAKEVTAGSNIAKSDEAFYNQFFDGEPYDSVSVLRVFCKEEDSFQIIANGVKITKDNQPMPWAHKEYPFVKMIFEPIGIDFFWGKSLPDKTGNISDAIDQLYNDLFNRNQLQLKAPMLVQQNSLVDDTVWRADAIIEYQGDKPEPLFLPNQGADYDRLQGILSEQLNQSTVAPVVQGQTEKGVTARGTIIAQENANELLNLFVRGLEDAEVNRTRLMLSNFLQFMTDPLVPSEVAGDDADATVESLRVFTQFATRLNNGKIGTREIRLKGEGQVTPPQMLEMEQDDYREIIEISAEFIKNLSLFIKISPNSSVKVSKSLQKALDIEYAQTMMALFPNLVDPYELAVQLTEAYEKNPQRVLGNQQQNPMAQMQQLMGQLPQQGQQGQISGQMTREPALDSLGELL